MVNTPTRDRQGRFTRNQGSNGDGQTELLRMILNTNFSRALLAKALSDPRRNYNDECGYPETASIGVETEYKELYDREPVAARVVQVLPMESWCVNPTVYEDEGVDTVTPFEEAWDAVAQSLRGTSWYRGEEGNPVWEYLRRIDILSGVGSYGVLLLGTDDGKELNEPAEGIEEENTYPAGTEGSGEEARVVTPYGRWTGNVYRLTTNAGSSARRLVYLRVFDELLASVALFESNPTSPRYGLPVMYNLTLTDPNESGRGGLGLPMATKRVHWTRVIHVADNCGSSEVFGVPRCVPC